MPDPINPVGAPNYADMYSTNAPENPGAVLDRDAFLKLLVAQLRYQDPTQPVDPSQMISQSSQLTMVEKLDDLTQQLAAQASLQRVTVAGSVLGKDVTFPTIEGTTVTARVTGVRIVGEDVIVRAGDYEVNLIAIANITEPPPASAPAPTPDATTATA